jgi:hypothetical protein
LDNQEVLTRYACGAVVFLGIGIVVTGNAIHLSNLAANSSFGGSRWIYSQAATAAYIFGVPTLIIGIGLTLIAYMQFNAMRQVEIRRPSLKPGSRRISVDVEPEIVEVACPDCGNTLGSELAMRRPDGSVVCGRCYKRFIPKTDP